MKLDDLEGELGGPMRVIELGELVVLPPATELSWRKASAAVTDPHAFAALVWPAGVPLTAWKLDVAHRGWIRHNGLPSPEQMRRLVYMLDRYSDGIEYDLRAHLGLSLGELWRERRWRELLNCIDLLPSNTHMNRLLTADDEHMEMLLRNKGSEQAGSGRPSMAHWGQLESMIASLIDEVRRGNVILQSVNAPKGSPKPRVQPYPRPYTAAERIQLRLQRERHEEMVSILLRDREERPAV